MQNQNTLDELFDNYDFYYKLVFRYARDQFTAEDALHNAYLKAIKARYESRPGVPVRKWFSVICINEAKSILLQRSREALPGAEAIEARAGAGVAEDELDFYFEDIVSACILEAPVKVRAALKENIVYDIPLLALAKKYSEPESVLRYWKKKIAKRIKEFL